MLAVTVIENTVLSAFGIFKSVSCLIRMRLRKIFFSNMIFYHFLQLCHQGHISKMLAVTVIENTVLSAFGIFLRTHSNKAGNGFENSKGA